MSLLNVLIFKIQMIISPFCLGLVPWCAPFCGFTSPFFTSFTFAFSAFKDPFWTGGGGGGTGELVVELLVEEGERVVEVVGVLGLGLCSGEATWLVRWVRSLSFTGFDVAHEARRGEPSCVFGKIFIVKLSCNHKTVMIIFCQFFCLLLQMRFLSFAVASLTH